MKFFKPKFWDKNQISLPVIFLFPFSLIFSLFIIYRKLFIKKLKTPIPVICVGNIYIGGTGKTPLCIEIYKIIKNLNKKPAFIKKKYDSFKDESNFLKKTGILFENKKRFNAILEAAEKKFDVGILDDGFQDLSIQKKFSIVCFNEKQWIGNGLIIPSGPLRESLSALDRADCVVINGKKNIDIEKTIFKKNKNIKIYYGKYESINIKEFIGKKVIAFAGIGNPGNFFDLLISNNINTVEKIKFPDHYIYSEKEIKNLIDKSKNNNSILITTEKDYFRINEKYKNIIYYIKIKFEIEEKDKFIKEIKKII